MNPPYSPESAKIISATPATATAITKSYGGYGGGQDRGLVPSILAGRHCSPAPRGVCPSCWRRGRAIPLNVAVQPACCPICGEEADIARPTPGRESSKVGEILQGPRERAPLL